jgi:protein phosphatase
MGTTCTIAGFLGDTLYLAQVGDSRGYLVRNGVAQQITKDQSLMQKLVEAGELTAEEAEVSERRNIILQALGPEPVVKVDLTQQQVRRDDVLVLCSDGLSGQMRAPDIARIVSAQPDLMQVCKELIDLANENGGPDNITVIAVRFDGDGLQVSSGGDGVGHQPYAGQSEQRATTPVDASLIPTEQEEEERARREAKTAETTAPRNFPGAERPSPAPMKAAAQPGSATAHPPRMSVGTLRIIFGAIAVALGAQLVYRFLHNK